MKKLYIVNYNAGNITSLFNAFNKVSDNDWQIIITQQPKDIKNADAVVLPGVGAFANCIENLTNIGFDLSIIEYANISNRPLLGICVGMQILANWGYENKKTAGLGLIAGEVIKIDINNQIPKLTLPQMGWNNVTLSHTTNQSHQHHLFKDINSEEQFYFANSYHFNAKNPESIIATTKYGQNIVASIAKNNIYGIQFHPEKSGLAGLKLLKNFLIL